MDTKPEVKIATLLEKGLVVLEKVMAKEVTLTKTEMIDLLNFETAVKFIVDAEHKAEVATTAKPETDTTVHRTIVKGEF